MRSIRAHWRALIGICILQGVHDWRCHAASIDSGRDFRQAMYWQQYARNGCIRLLNSTHQLGCSSQGAVEAPLEKYSSAALPLEGDRVLMVEEGLLGELLQEDLAQSGVAGILVALNPTPRGGQGYAVEGGATWELWEEFPLPIQAASGGDAEQLLQKAKDNAATGFQGALHTAALDNGMQGRHNSSQCLEGGTCDPLGGHSVWAAMPPFLPGKPRGDLPVTLVVAQTDGLGLFHDLIWGADAPISGLTALLVAAEILKNSTLAYESFQRRLVFVALRGEPWGNQGSKRLLWELKNGENSTAGLDLSRIDQVLELGPVGRAVPGLGGETQLFFHGTQATQGGGRSLWEVVQSSAAATTEVDVKRSAGNISVGSAPPQSSLPSFLRANSSIDGGFLAEFDAAPGSPYYATPHDDLSGINYRGIAASAILAAKSLHALVTTVGTLKVDQAAVAARVEELMACMAKPGALLDCPAAKRSITRAGMVSNYVGVLHTLTKNSQDPHVNVKSDMARFIWNTLAAATSNGPAKLAAGGEGGCDSKEHVCEEGAVCVNYRVGEKGAAGNGECLFATARYVPSYSTAIRCKDCSGEAWGRWEATQAAEEWEREKGWPRDPMWTESRWAEGIPSMLVFQKESAAVESRVLLAGILVTLLTYCLYLIVRVARHFRLKQH